MRRLAPLSRGFFCVVFAVCRDVSFCNHRRHRNHRKITDVVVSIKKPDLAVAGSGFLVAGLGCLQRVIHQLAVFIDDEGVAAVVGDEAVAPVQHAEDAGQAGFPGDDVAQCAGIHIQ